LSPLSPLLSSSEQRKLARRRARQGGQDAAAGGAAGEVEDAIPTWQQQQQQRPGGRKQGKGKQRRRERPLGPSQLPQRVQLEDEGAAVVAPAAVADPGALVSGDYGYFERHTTGIGSRLLAKWGFEGEGSGLGRGGQGIAEPLRAARRAKGLGLGAER
jgi:hypothetical protein